MPIWFEPLVASLLMLAAVALHGGGLFVLSSAPVEDGKAGTAICVDWPRAWPIGAPQGPAAARKSP